jgi:L-fuculose-phosphate aldolase
MDDRGAQLRDHVALGCRVLGANGHDDFVWGHASVRDPGGRGVWMKAAGRGFEEVGDDGVVLVGEDGAVLAGDAPRHSEWPIHTEIVAAREDVGAVVHSHPPHAIALAAVEAPLLAVSHAGALFVPPDVPRFTLTANLIITRELGRAVAECLGAANALFMVNHGIVTVGATLQEAVVRAVLLEKACHQQLLAMGAGRMPVAPSPEATLEKRATVWPPAHLDALWSYLVRRLDAEARA